MTTPMNLQDLVEQYAAQEEAIHNLVEEKNLLNRKLDLAATESIEARRKILRLFPENDKSIKTFHCTLDNRQLIVQINLSFNPPDRELITFYDVSAAQDFVMPTE